MESFAFGGEAPKKQSGGEGIAVGEPEAPWALPYAVGTSSWAPGGMENASHIAGDIGNIRSKYWPVTSPILPKPQAATTYELGDGGLIDNSGMMALLQRKAPKIVWVASCFTSFSTSYDWANATPENFNPASAGVVDQLYVLFGYNTTSEGYYYANDQVFDQSLCFETCKELHDLQLAGKPVIAIISYTSRGQEDINPGSLEEEVHRTPEQLVGHRWRLGGGVGCFVLSKVHELRKSVTRRDAEQNQRRRQWSFCQFSNLQDRDAEWRRRRHRPHHGAGEFVGCAR